MQRKSITVKSVRFEDSKNLEATIDVAADAQTTLEFDVQVKCNSRTGKGTELFKVLEKTTGGDIPPGSATGLTFTEGALDDVYVTYTMPAEDGYDASTGPAPTVKIRIRACGPYTVATGAGEWWEDPCYVWEDDVSTGAVGARVTVGPFHLAPNTDYWALMRSRDSSQPAGIWSSLEDDLQDQAWFLSGQAPNSPWSYEFFDSCPPGTAPTSCDHERVRLDFDRNGDPAIFFGQVSGYQLARRDQIGWIVDPVWNGILAEQNRIGFSFSSLGSPSVSRVALSGGRWDGRLFTCNQSPSEAWTDDLITASNGVRGTSPDSHPLAFSPGGTASVLYTYVKGSAGTLRLAEKRADESWTTDTVAVNPVGSWHHLAFDDAGNPGVAYFVSDAIPNNDPMVFATRENGVWHSEVVTDQTTVGAGWAAMVQGHVAFDAHRGGFAAVYRTYQYPLQRLYCCERLSSAWTCERIGGNLPWGANVSLAIGPDGTVHVAYDAGHAVFVSSRTAPAEAWTKEYVGWGSTGASGFDLEVHPDGRLSIAYAAAHDATGMGSTSSVVFAQRPAPAQ